MRNITIVYQPGVCEHIAEGTWKHFIFIVKIKNLWHSRSKITTARCQLKGLIKSQMTDENETALGALNIILVQCCVLEMFEVAMYD